MKQQDVEMFLSIVENKSISAAAAALHYAQPTVSASLNQLEKTLGVQLIRRTKGKRTVELTSAGAEFLPLARQYQELEHRLFRFIKAHQHGVLRLAASVVSHQYIICHVAQKLLRTMPELEIRLSTLEIKDVGEAAANHDFDVAISYDAPDYPTEKLAHVKAVPLFQETYRVLCPADTPLPDRLLTPEELDPAFEVVQEGYGNPLMQDWRVKHGFGDAKPFFKASSMLSLHTYLTDPRCWSFVLSNTAVQMADTYPEALTVRQVSPAPVARTCYALVLDAYPDENVVQALLQCMDEFVDERPHLQKVLRASNDCILQEMPAGIK